jgi:indolepyruvate ferredoxin oxidoreductase
MSAVVTEKRLDTELSDRFTEEQGWHYMTGMHALVRLPIQQRMRDQRTGLNTGGFISGYRGSPLGRYDMELWQAQSELDKHNIVFTPGVNEDLAATAAWGSQLVGTFPGARVDGVFSIWYGKAPGMDRSMDPIRHANLAGTSATGGSLLLVGDDHGAKSSTVACYSDFNFMSAGIPLFAPVNAQEVLDYGLHAFAMSRYSGCLAGMKLVTDVIEGGGSVYVAPDSPHIVIPDVSEDVHIQPAANILEQERRLYEVKLDLALQYIRSNGINEIQPESGATPKLGIVAAGKSWQDLRQGLRNLGFDDGMMGSMPVRLLKVGVVWPLDDAIVREFADGLETIIVVEEKRPLLEDQIRSILYDQTHPPKIVGKYYEGQSYSSQRGEVAFKNTGELDPMIVSRVIARVALSINPACGIVTSNEPESQAKGSSAMRLPSFCSGCPHGRSTQLPDGSRALAGIGCHSMAALQNPETTNSMSHMGGEGAMWIGQKPFTDEEHVFTNMGDGTYFHSGYLAIRAAVAADIPITYKLLHNGFVSMTGGQPIDGEVTPASMIEQVRAEGVKRIALVVDEPEKYQSQSFPEGVTLHHRREMDMVQQQFRVIPGVTVIIYDQPCATERRRLRKRGKWVDPDERIYINSAVCEGCGDCSTVSRCMSIEPLETELGRKRKINQSSCNKDYSCIEGFCPSFVTISGAKLKSGTSLRTEQIDIADVPEPVPEEIDGSFAVLVSGIGGTGVVTVGQTLAVAGHLDGLFSSNLDVTGLAQKYGAVHSHVKFARDTKSLFSTRIAEGEARAILGCDLVTVAGEEAMSKLSLAGGIVISDSVLVPTSEFARNPDWSVDKSEMIDVLIKAGGDQALILDLQQLGEKVLGDTIFANMILIGAAWQRGALPLSLEAMIRAIELNGVKVELNKHAFNLGRMVAHDPSAADRLTADAAQPVNIVSAVNPTEALIENRRQYLTDYQNGNLADRYLTLVRRVEEAENAHDGDGALTEAVARYYFKVLAIKDPWEVARLYARPEFVQELKQTFDGDLKIRFHVGMWPFARFDRKTGRIEKGEAGGWVMHLFRIMSGFRKLRGSWLDPFRFTPEARFSASLLATYETDVEFALKNIGSGHMASLVELLSLPEHIRGYGHVREQHAADVNDRKVKIMATVNELARDVAA